MKWTRQNILSSKAGDFILEILSNTRQKSHFHFNVRELVAWSITEPCLKWSHASNNRAENFSLTNKSAGLLVKFIVDFPRC